MKIAKLSLGIILFDISTSLQKMEGKNLRFLEVSMQLTKPSSGSYHCSVKVVAYNTVILLLYCVQSVLCFVMGIEISDLLQFR